MAAISKFNKHNRSTWNIRDWEKHDSKGLLKMKQEQPEKYGQLFNLYYGKDNIRGTEAALKASAEKPVFNKQDRSTWSMRDWEKHDSKGLLKMKSEQPEKYRQLFTLCYGEI